MNNTNKKILVFASKYAGRETFKYLIENKTPIDHVIVAGDYDREILELSIKNNISTEIYSNETQDLINMQYLKICEYKSKPMY